MLTERRTLLFVSRKTSSSPVPDTSLPRQRRPNTGDVVIAVPDGVILEHELAREWGIGIERHRGSPIELLIAERPNGGRSGGAVTLKQIQRRVFRDGVVLPGVPGIDLVYCIPRHARHRLAPGERLCQLDLERVHRRDVMHDHADLAPVLRNTGLTLRVRQGTGEGGKGARPVLEANGKGFSPYLR